MSTAVRAIIFVCTLVIVAAARKNSLQLGSLIYYKTGRSPSDYENYGCWCGADRFPDSHTAFVDQIDLCCKIHSECYSDIISKYSSTCESIDWVPYVTQFDDGKVSCINKEKPSLSICGCDKAMAECFQKSDSIFNKKNIGKCQPKHVTVITFDDIFVETSNSVSIPNGYKNLTWSGAGVTNVINSTKSGYRNGLVSGQFVGMTYDRQSMTITSERLFTLKSLWATAAWNDNLTLAITGSLSFGLLNQKYIKTVVIQATEKTFVEFDDWEGINHLLFNSSGGKPHPAFTSHSATHVVLDDLAIEF